MSGRNIKKFSEFYLDFYFFSVQAESCRTRLDCQYAIHVCPSGLYVTCWNGLCLCIFVHESECIVHSSVPLNLKPNLLFRKQ